MSDDLAKKIEEAKVKVDQIIATCVEETGVGEDVPKKLKSGDFSVRGEKAKVSFNFEMFLASFYAKKIAVLRQLFLREIWIRELCR